MAKPQAQLMKNPRSEEYKAQGLASMIFQCSNNFKRFEKVWKNKKKNQRNHDQQQNQQQKSFIPAIEVNIAKPGKPKNKNDHRNQNCLSKISSDSKENMYYNYNKKGHFTKSYLKPPKN